MDVYEALRIIRRYEAEIGRQRVGSVTARLTEALASGKVDDETLHRTEQYAMKCRDRIRYFIELEGCLNGTLPSHSAVSLSSSTPRLLSACGVPDTLWLHTQRHILDEIHPKDPENTKWHGLSVRQLRRVPELLERPCAVVEPVEGKRGLVVMLGTTDKDGLPIIMAVAPWGKGIYRNQLQEANFVLSIYGRTGADEYLSYAAATNRVLYIDKEKAGSILARSGLLLPETCKMLPDKMIIQKVGQKVNRLHDLNQQVKLDSAYTLDEEANGTIRAANRISAETQADKEPVEPAR